MMVRGDDSTHPYFLARMLFDSDERQALLPTSGSEAAKQSLEQVLERSVAESQSLDSINRVSYLETNFYMRNTLLRDSDFMSMALGLEIRVPFLDKTLVETCFQIPGAQKLEGRSAKGLLLASLGVELPPEIMNRPKRGFTLPFERWMRGAMRPTVEDTLLNGDWGRVSIDGNAVREVWDRFLSRQTSWSRPWSLFVLKRWCEQNL
jgi:asparagine synthase (glutamine-hydrolysing)